MKTNDGGPAFPLAHDIPPKPGAERSIKVEGGMSLRDYFAAKAMSAMIHETLAVGDDYPKPMIVVQRSYVYADAMLEAREYRAGEQPTVTGKLEMKLELPKPGDEAFDEFVEQVSEAVVQLAMEKLNEPKNAFPTTES